MNLPSESLRIAKGLIASMKGDFEELASRGFGHPDPQPVVGRITVSMQQLEDQLNTAPVSVTDLTDKLATLSEHLAVVQDVIASLKP